MGDYYMEGQAVSGQWFGQGAGELGLTGVVERYTVTDNSTTIDDVVAVLRKNHVGDGENLDGDHVVAAHQLAGGLVVEIP